MPKNATNKGKPSPPGQGKSRAARRRRAKRSKSNKSSGKRRDVFMGPIGPVGIKPDDFCRQYAAVLDEPFHHEPVRLGFGTLVPTSLSVSRISASFGNGGGDGSVLVVVKPCVRSPLSYSIAGFNATPSWLTISDGAWSTVSSLYDSARPIALGLRVTALGAGTAGPSTMVAGQINYTADNASSTLVTALGAIKCTDWYNSHLGTKAYLNPGALNTVEQTWRPAGLQNFQFSYDYLDAVPANTGTAVFPNQGPVIFAAIQGPTTTTYDFEVVFYYEALSSYTNPTPGIGPKTETASDYFPSLENFYNKVTKFITDENVAHVANMAAGAATAWRKFSPNSRMLRYTPSVFAAHEDDGDVVSPPTTTPKMPQSRGMVRSLADLVIMK